MLLKILKSAGVRQTAVLTGGNFLATAFSAVGLLLISRVLGPLHFGEFTVGYSLMIIIVRVQGLGLNVAIQKIAGRYFHDPDGQAKLNKVFRIGTTLNVALSVLFIILGFVLAKPIANILHIEQVNIIFGSFIFATITLFFEYLTTILQVLHRFTQSVYLMMIQSVLKFLVALGLFMLGTKDVTLAFYSFYLTPLVAIAFGVLTLPKKVTMLPFLRDPQTEKHLIAIMKHSAILMVTAGIIDYIDILFVQRYTTPLETGVYGGISQLAGAVTVIAYSLAAVLNARVARYHSKVDIDAYIKKALAIVGITIVTSLIYLPLTSLSIYITLGTQYLLGTPYLSVLMISSFILVATVPFIALFYSFDTHRYFSVSGIGQLVIAVVGGNYMISHFGLDGAVWTKVLTRTFLFLLTVIWAAYAYRQKVGSAKEKPTVPVSVVP